MPYRSVNLSFPTSQFSVTPSEYVTDSLVLKAIPQPSSSLINCSFSEVPVILVIVTVSADSLEDSSPPADVSYPAVSTELFSDSSSVSPPTICSPSLSESSICTSVSVLLYFYTIRHTFFPFCHFLSVTIYSYIIKC